MSCYFLWPSRCIFLILQWPRVFELPMYMLPYVCVCSVLNNRHYSVACHVKALMHSLPFSAPAKPRPNSPGIATAVSEIVEHLSVVLFHNTLLFLQKKRSVQRAQSDSNTVGCKYILTIIYFLSSTNIDNIKRRWRRMTLKVPGWNPVVSSRRQAKQPWNCYCSFGNCWAPLCSPVS